MVLALRGCRMANPVRNCVLALTRLCRGRRPLLAGFLASALLAGVPAAHSEDGTPTAHPNVAMCQGCHGIAGYRVAYPDVYSVPKLGGQQAAYLVKALQDYRGGTRKYPTMQSVAATLSDQEIAALAAYYAGSGQ